jgi:hypothetical protein
MLLLLSASIRACWACGCLRAMLLHLCQLCLNHGLGEQHGGSRTLALVVRQAHLHQRREILTVNAWSQWVPLARNDLEHQRPHILRSKRRGELAKLVQNAAKRPNITLHRVGAALTQLWGKVERRPNGCIAQLFAVFQQFGHAEITQFGVAVAVQEDIRRLQVAMQNFAPMYKFERLRGL